MNNFDDIFNESKGEIKFIINFEFEVRRYLFNPFIHSTFLTLNARGSLRVASISSIVHGELATKTISQTALRLRWATEMERDRGKRVSRLLEMLSIVCVCIRTEFNVGTTRAYRQDDNETRECISRRFGGSERTRIKPTKVSTTFTSKFSPASRAYTFSHIEHRGRGFCVCSFKTCYSIVRTELLAKLQPQEQWRDIPLYFPWIIISTQVACIPKNTDDCYNEKHQVQRRWQKKKTHSFWFSHIVQA